MGETEARDPGIAALRQQLLALTGEPEIELERGPEPPPAVDISGLESRLAALEGAVGERLAQLRSAVAEAMEQLAAAVEASLASVGEQLGAEQVLSLDQDSVSALADAVAARLGPLASPADLQALRGDLADALDELRTDLTALLESRAAVRATEAEAALAEARAAREALVRTEDRIDGASRALVDYLAQRDIALEAERDRIVHELLDDFAGALRGGERKRVAERTGGMLERRRDQRDATRWRSQRAGDAQPGPAGGDEEGLEGLLRLADESGRPGEGSSDRPQPGRPRPHP